MCKCVEWKGSKMKSMKLRYSPWGAASVVLTGLLFGGAVLAPGQAKYGPGASAKEIKLGQPMPYSGPAYAYGTIGKVHQSYFKMTNDNVGINGRMINLTSVDDGYSPPRAVEQ